MDLNYEKLLTLSGSLSSFLEGQDVHVMDQLDQYGILNHISYEFKFQHRFAQILEKKKDTQQFITKAYFKLKIFTCR